MTTKAAKQLKGLDAETFCELVEALRHQVAAQENVIFQLRNAQSNRRPDCSSSSSVQDIEAHVRELYHGAPRAFDWLTQATDEFSPGRIDSWEYMYKRERLAHMLVREQLQQVQKGGHQDWEKVEEQVRILHLMISANRARTEIPQSACVSSVKFPKPVTQNP